MRTKTLRIVFFLIIAALVFPGGLDKDQSTDNGIHSTDKAKQQNYKQNSQSNVEEQAEEKSSKQEDEEYQKESQKRRNFLVTLYGEYEFSTY